jgi:hypothetical protein
VQLAPGSADEGAVAGNKGQFGAGGQVEDSDNRHNAVDYTVVQGGATCMRMYSEGMYGASSTRP